MKYFQVNDKEYQIDFRYLTYEDANAIFESMDSKPSLRDCNNSLELDIYERFKEKSRFPINEYDYLQHIEKLDGGWNAYKQNQMYCVATLYEVETDNGVNTYNYIAEGWSRRSHKDNHIKKVAREIAIRRMIKEGDLDSDVKEAIIKEFLINK